MMTWVMRTFDSLPDDPLANFSWARVFLWASLELNHPWSGSFFLFAGATMMEEKEAASACSSSLAESSPACIRAIA